MAQYFYVSEEAFQNVSATSEQGSGDGNPQLVQYQSPPGTPHTSHGQFQQQWVIQNDNGANVSQYQNSPQLIYTNTQNTQNHGQTQTTSLIGGNMIVHQPMQVQLNQRNMGTYIIHQQPQESPPKMVAMTSQPMMRTASPVVGSSARPQIVPFILNPGYRNQMQITRNAGPQSVIIQQQPVNRVPTPQSPTSSQQVIVDPRNFSIIQQTAQPVPPPPRPPPPPTVTYKLVQTKGPPGTTPVRFYRAPTTTTVTPRTILTRHPVPRASSTVRPQVRGGPTPVGPRPNSPVVRLRPMLPSSTAAQPPRPPLRLPSVRPRHSTPPVPVRQPVAAAPVIVPMRQQRPVIVYQPLVEVRQPDTATTVDDDIENNLSSSILHKTNSLTAINDNRPSLMNTQGNAPDQHEIIQGLPMPNNVISTERNDTAKMLVCLPDEERRLITFTLPTESCTVTELLDQVGITITPCMTVKCLSLTDGGLDYLVTITENKYQELSELTAPSIPALQPRVSMGQPTLLMKNMACSVSKPETPTPKVPVHVPKFIEGYWAICDNCGYTSLDHAKCERCGRILSNPQKRRINENRNSLPEAPHPRTPPRTPSHPIRAINGTSSAGRLIRLPANSADRSKMTVTTTTCTRPLTGSSRPAAASVKPAASRGRGAGRGRGRLAKKIEEPVVYTLSSDDEGEEEEGGQGASQSAPFPFEPSISPQTLAEGEISDAERVDVCSDVTSGNSVNTNLECTSIRFGSYAVPATGRQTVSITHLGIKFLVPSVRDEGETVKLNIQHGEIMKFIVHYEKHLPVIFLYTTPSCGRYIRRVLGMGNVLSPAKPNAPPPPFYDPANNLEYVKRIVIVAKVIRDDTKSAIKMVFPLQMYDEISHRDALELLNRSVGGGAEVESSSGNSAAGTNSNNKQPESSESKAERMTTRGKASAEQATLAAAEDQIHKLMIYPQGKGGISINTEDYKCLAVDQFLNDVIIDFYLKYIHQEVMTPQQREKAHIFSSFFYKRLTATSARQRHLERELKMTPAQKRHNRVKSWTKNVDLFEKEFIVIPINELSHWFLAVICFPGADKPRSLKTGQVVAPPKLPRLTARQSALTKQAVKDLAKRNPTGISVTIGNTTITPVTKREENIYVNEETLSERDEAEGDESDMMTDDEEGEEKDTIKNSQDEPISQPCILLFDSLRGAYRSRVVATLREYLTCEFKARNTLQTPRVFDKVHMPGHNVKIPQQNNYTDCGLFLLQYVEELSRHPIPDFKLPLKGLQTWFEIDEVTRKREDIAILIKEMVGREHPERLELIPEIKFPTVNGVVVEEGPALAVASSSQPVESSNTNCSIVRQNAGEGEEQEAADSEELFYEVENSCVNEGDMFEEEEATQEAAGTVKATKLKIPMPNKRKSAANASPSDSAMAKKSARIT